MADTSQTDPASEKPIAMTDPQPDLTNASRHRSDSASSKTLDVETTETTTQSKEDVPPDGGYGWVCVACNFFINGHTWGINSSYGVFLSYYLSHDYFPNTGPLTYAFIGGLSISMALLIAPLATRCIHSYGTRTTLYIGVFLETLSLIASSFTRTKYQIILSQGICFGFGMGFLFIGSVGIIAQWFTTRRSVANAIAAAGSGLGGLMYSLIAQRCIDTLGLPWAFRILGLCSLVVNLTASTLLRDRNTAVGSKQIGFDRRILRRPEFLFMQGWAFFSLLGYVILLFSVASYAVSIGLSAQQGTIVSALLNLGQMLGRPFVGLSSDRFGRINLAAGLSVVCGIFCLVLWIPTELCPSPMGLLVVFVLVGGALAGTFWATIAAVGAEVVGLRDLPSALSMTWLGLVVPSLVAEPIALELRRGNTRSFIYLYAQVFVALSYVAAGLCLWIVRGWKVGEIEAHKRLVAEKRRRESVRREEGVQEGNPIEAEFDPAASHEGWELKGLLRRMWKWIIV
jgi:MFS family permease